MITRFAILLLLLKSNLLWGQWTIEYPLSPQNSHYLMAKVPHSDEVYLLGNDLLRFNLSSKELSRIADYPLQLNFKNSLTTSPSPDTHSAIAFVSVDTGFIAHRDEILKTYDGGKHWVVVKKLLPLPSHPPLSAYFTDIYFPSAEIGYAVGTFEKIFKTIDGGESWKEIRWSQNATPYRRLSKVVFNNEKEGLLIGYETANFNLNTTENKAFILKTENGGESWEENYPLPNAGSSNHHLAKLSYATDNTLYLALTNQTFLFAQDKLIRSINGGQDWDEIALPGFFNQSLIIRDMHWFDAERGLLVASTSSLNPGNRIYKTINGGDHWEEIELNVWPYSGFQKGYSLATAFDEENGLIIGASGNILHSTDSGESWESIRFPYPDITAMKMLSQNEGYAVGNNGLVLKKAGQDWDILPPPVSSHQYIDDFKRIDFADVDRGVLLGFSKDVYRTIDQGISWEQLLIRNDTNALDIGYHGNNLYVLSLLNNNRLVVLKRTDGNNAWSTLEIDNQSPKGFQKGRLQILSDGQLIASYDDALYKRDPTSGDWDLLNTAGVGNFEDRFYFQSKQNGFLAKGNEIWSSSNGGEFWSKASFSPEVDALPAFQINGFTSLSPTHLIAIGRVQETESTYAKDIYFRSTNGGLEWELLDIPFQQESSLRGISAWSVVNNHLFIGTTNGTIFKYTANLPTAIDDKPYAPRAIQLYPNPTQNKLFIKGDVTVGRKWAIYSVDGVDVNHAVNIDQGVITVNNLAPGIYFIQTDIEGIRHIGRFIKQ